MSLRVDAARIAAVYEMWRAFPPFSRWNLPPSSEVAFHVLRTNQLDGDWWYDGERHHIRVSAVRHAHMVSLLDTVAHEMVHLHQHQSGTATNAVHNADFRRIAGRICKLYGFDEGKFLG